MPFLKAATLCCPALAFPLSLAATSTGPWAQDTLGPALQPWDNYPTSLNLSFPVSKNNDNSTVV